MATAGFSGQDLDRAGAGPSGSVAPDETGDRRRMKKDQDDEGRSVWRTML